MLLAQTAFLPATVVPANEDLLHLPFVNLSGTPSVAGVAPISISTRRIVLAFQSKGRPIPENEVKDTLIEADQIVVEIAHDHPTQRITNDQFEYRRPNGNMLIMVKTNPQEEITWTELARILQGLYKYMTAGMGAEETHYQELEFEIEASGQVKPNIGLGLVWYINSEESKSQNRATPSLPTSTTIGRTLQFPNLTFPQASNKTMRRLPDAILVLPGPNDVQKTTIFPIPRTPLSLSFYFFGQFIPAKCIKATLQGASAKVRPFLNGPSAMKPITNEAFQYIPPLSGEADTPVAVTVFAYHGHQITWRQLFDVLFGLYSFVTTFGTDLVETHYQVLGFRIVDNDSRSLGVGTISYFRSETAQLSKRAGTIGNGSSLWPLSAPNVASLGSTVSRPMVYPVPNTDITLTFTFLGDTPIPPPEIVGALYGARERIAREVSQRPDVGIPGKFHDISRSNHVSTNILVYGAKSIRWRELDNILKGVLHFCLDDQSRDRVLVFEIDIEAASRGRVGFGTLLYAQSNPINVGKRALVAKDTSLQLPNSTILSQPSLTALAVPMPYPIPGTPITLTFTDLGSPIPSIYVNAAFTSALRKIQTHVIHHPNDPVPNGHWESQGAVSRVWIGLVTYTDLEISWQELSFVIASVLRFMTRAVEQQCRDLDFIIDKVGELTGYGYVTYFPEARVRESRTMIRTP